MLRKGLILLLGAAALADGFLMGDISLRRASTSLQASRYDDQVNTMSLVGHLQSSITWEQSCHAGDRMASAPKGT